MRFFYFTKRKKRYSRWNFLIFYCKNDINLTSIQCLQCQELFDVLHVLSLLKLILSLSGCYCHDPHFVYEDTKALRMKQFAQDHTGGKWLYLGLEGGPPDTVPYCICFQNISIHYVTFFLPDLYDRKHYLGSLLSPQ